LKSSELMIFEGRSDIISTAFLLQTVLKICRSSFCAFVSCIWSNSPLRIILIDSSVNTLAEQDFTVHLHLISPFFLMKAWRNFWSSTTMTGFPYQIQFSWMEFQISLLVENILITEQFIRLWVSFSLGQLNFITKG
jgi:hypothetical protein